jgi:hypothetical protein
MLLKYRALLINEASPNGRNRKIVERPKKPSKNQSDFCIRIGKSNTDLW